MRRHRRSRDKVHNIINPPKYLLGTPSFVGFGLKACIQIASRIVLSVEGTFLGKTIYFLD